MISMIFNTNISFDTKSTLGYLTDRISKLNMKKLSMARIGKRAVSYAERNERLYLFLVAGFVIADALCLTSANLVNTYAANIITAAISIALIACAALLIIGKYNKRRSK